MSDSNRVCAGSINIVAKPLKNRHERRKVARERNAGATVYMLLHEASGHRAHASTRFNTPAQQVHHRLLKTGQKRAYSIEFEQSWRNIKLPHTHRCAAMSIDYAMDSHVHCCNRTGSAAMMHLLL